MRCAYRNLAGRLNVMRRALLSIRLQLNRGYGIDFSGSNDTGWHELLTITEAENEIVEEVIIKKDDVGEVLRKSWRKSK
jgi:hypothetical protein